MTVRDAETTEDVADPIIEVRDLVTRYGEKVVHDGVNFDVNRGEVFAIVGGSGSGKSTIMRQIVMLNQPTSGSIKVFGEEVTKLDDIEGLPLRRKIGVMFQYGALFSDMSVLENVCLPLSEHTDLDRTMIRELAVLKLRMSNLDASVAPLYPAQLSGGMNKRAALAREIALDPQLLVLDEPGSGLDPVSARALDDLIIQLKELLGLTIVMITHDMQSLCNVADRVVFLGERRALAIGRPGELKHSEHAQVSEFFASADQ